MDFVIDNSIKTNIVQKNKDIYSLEIVMVGEKCIKKIKKLIKQNRFILNLSLRLRSMIGIITNLEIEANFQDVKLNKSQNTYALNNVTYKFKEE